MARNPTQPVTEYLTRDAAILCGAQRRLTLANEPTGVSDRVAHALRRPDARGYFAARNERVVYTSVRLGALRRALLAWAFARVHWPEVVHGVTRAADERANASARTPYVVGIGRHRVALEFDPIAR